MRFSCFSLLFFILSLGCSEEKKLHEKTSLNTTPRSVISAFDESKEDTSSSEDPTLVFSKDFTETLSQKVYSGDVLTIQYDLKRAVNCKREGRSFLQYLTGFYQVDDQEPKSFEYIPSYTTAHLPQKASIQVPEGQQLAFWFYIVDTNGCETWDSNADEKYILPISSRSSSMENENVNDPHLTGHDSSEMEHPNHIDEDGLEESIISFLANGEIKQTLPLKSGDQVLIRYDLKRLNACESVQNQIPQWGITGFFKTDLSEKEFFTLTETIEGELKALDVEISVPEGNQLEIGFTASNQYGCFQEDRGGVFELN